MEKEKIIRIEQTCSACPSQWSMWTESGKYVYVRFRWGNLSCTLFPNEEYNLFSEEAEVVYSKKIGNDDYNGWMDESEMIEHLSSVLDFSMVK